MGDPFHDAEDVGTRMASLDHGALTITGPQSEAAKPRRIPTSGS
ncbi:hypothetical protein B0I33_1154 [Prauserella shujinwangii]|uniref:Hsp20/alpha crystallin family protein n=1 Tax=Prauserella shujinwangii TaxID=1453103 RepID=A0A2T0LKF5_9PSEU|nr:hypothetical protein B0I33_1154 [Prauserella shujinwangii]